MKLTRRAFVKSLSITLIGVSSCTPPSKEKEQKKTPVDLDKKAPSYKGHRHDTDDATLKAMERLDNFVENMEIPMQDRKLAEAGYENRVVRMKVTAYCPCSKCCGKWADGITASGHVIKKGDKLIAADKRYPFQVTWMHIPGYKIPPGKYVAMQTITGLKVFAPVLDRGGAIKGNHIDVYFDTHQEALNWGVQFLDVIVLSFSHSEHEEL